MIRRARGALALAILLVLLPASREGARAAGPPASATPPVLTIGGLVGHKLHLTADALRKLPSEDVHVSFRSEHGITTANFTGVALWTLLTDAGGIADPAKQGVLRHWIRVTGADGYRIVISTGEISPEFGARPAMVAYARDGKPLAGDSLRLVMPGDVRGGRDVSDLVTIEVK